MAKRLGNFLTVKDMRDKGIDGETLRFLLLSGHYRAQLNFTEKSLDQASSSVKRMNEFYLRLKEVESTSNGSSKVTDLVEKTRVRYITSLENDLDTPSALAVIFEFITEGNKILDQGSFGRNEVNLMLEFMMKDFNYIFGAIKKVTENVASPEIRSLLKEREEARKNKDWAKSDAVRKRLLELGIEVQDTPQGQKWRMA